MKYEVIAWIFVTGSLIGAAYVIGYNVAINQTLKIIKRHLV